MFFKNIGCKDPSNWVYGWFCNLIKLSYAITIKLVHGNTNKLKSRKPIYEKNKKILLVGSIIIDFHNNE